MEETVIGILPFIPLIGSFITPIIGYISKNDKRLIQCIAIAISLIPLILSIYLIHITYSVDHILVYRFGGWSPPIGIVYMVDRASALLVLVTTLVMFLVAIYSYRYLEHYGGYTWYYTLYLGLEAGLLGVLLTGDVFNMFVMIEVVSVASYSLVMFYRHRGDSITAGLKYAIIGSLGTTIYFLALGIIYAMFGTVNLFDLVCKIHGEPYPVTGMPWGDIVLATAIAMVLVSWTFMIKAGVFPNHFWLPDAHPAAPTPISAILSGLVVNVGAYAMFRYMYTIYGKPLPGELEFVINIISALLLLAGAISAIIGSLLMHIQRDIKRIIAYSTVVHMGYLFMAIALRTNLGASAFTLHIVNHSIGKATLFLAAGIFIYCIGSRYIDRIGGLARDYPVATIALVTAGLNLAGIPPLPIFYSKLLLFYALFEYHPIYALILVVTSAIALIAYLRILYVTLFGRKVVSKTAKAPNSMRTVLVIFVILIIVMGVYSSYIIENYINPAIGQLVSIDNYMVRLGL
ncbi:MAG: proton-conducting transporter membrane subunit [Thermoprotei archaeon]